MPAMSQDLPALIEACEVVADELDRGTGDPRQALLEIVRLRKALAAYQAKPFRVPIARIERRSPLASPLVAELHATLDALRDHLAC